MKSIKDFDVKYVLASFEEKEIISGTVGCRCTVSGAVSAVAGTLIVDNGFATSHYWNSGDRCIEGLI